MQDKKIIKFAFIMGLIFTIISSYFLFRQYVIYTTGEEVVGTVIRMEPISMSFGGRRRRSRITYKPLVEYEINNQKYTYIQNWGGGCSKNYTPYCISDFNPIDIGDSVILVVSEYGIIFKDFRGDIVGYLSFFLFGLLLLTLRFYFCFLQLLLKIIYEHTISLKKIDKKYALPILLFIVLVFFFLNQKTILETLEYIKK